MIDKNREQIFEYVADALGHREFDRTTDIREAGLTAAGKTLKLIRGLSAAFGRNISIRDIRENPTVEKLERFLSGDQPQKKYDLQEDYPLTETQKGILADSLVNPETTIYNLPFYVKLPDSVDPERLKKAVETVIDSHPYLKMTLFTDEKGETRARRNDDTQPVVEIISVDAFPADQELVRPFRILDGPLYRVVLYRTPSGNYLFWDMHHLIYDGESFAIFMDDIGKVYAGESVKPESFTGFEAALAEEEERRTERYAKAKEYYDNTFGGCDANCLPLPDRKGETPEAGFLDLPSGIDHKAVKAWCASHDVAPNSFYNAVFGFTVSRFNYANEAVYTTIFSGRSDSRLADTIGMYVKTIPVLSQVDQELSVVDYVRTIQRQIFDSIGNDLYSFAEISNAYDIPADLSFGYQPRLGKTITFDGTVCEVVRPRTDTAISPLSVDIVINGDAPSYAVEYYSNLYSEEFIKVFLASLDQTAQAFLKEEKLKDISICPDAETERIRGWNATDYPVEMKNLCELFAEQVEAHPERAAVIAGETELSYAELDRLSNRIANALIRRGLSLGEVVGMLLPRTEAAPASEYGILKAGGAFLPMLPDYPDDRISYCMIDSGSRFVITTQKLLENRKEIFEGQPYTALPIEELYQEENTSSPKLDIPADSLAYCIYTSGSTGKPKGVMIEHGNLCNFVNANKKNMESYEFVKGGQVALAIASLSFDVSIMEIHLSLLNGMTVCLAGDDESHDPLPLADLVRKHQVEVVCSTPSFLANVLDIPEAAEAFRTVKLYDIGAEAFPPALYDKLRKASPEAVIVNGYGPTEATISCIAKVIESAENITIGTPAANVKAWVFDRFGNMLPPYARGELVIGGIGVGRGYMNLPEKTKEAFLTVEGGRAYRTGDAVRFAANGEIEFFGRLDNQVKLHGLRIELDEIENVMNTYPSVNRSVVLVRGRQGGDEYLAAYFTSSEPVDLADLKAHISKKLARYMVPQAFVRLDEIPLTKNGKVDKKALPEPELQQAEIVAPVTDEQKKIHACVAEVLGRENFGITTDLFEAGLSSLGAIRLSVLLSREFEVPVAIRDIQACATIMEIEAFLAEQKPEEAFALQADYPLTQTQTGILVESLAHPDTTIYNVPSLYRISERLDTEKLKLAIETAVSAHPYLFATLFTDDQGNFRVRRDDEKKPAVEIVRTSALPDELVKPFDLMGEQLYRIRIYLTDAGNYLFMEFHHILYDGASDAVLMEDINAAYAGETVEKESFSGFEAALEEERLLASDRYARAKQWYETLLGDMDREMLPEGDVFGQEHASAEYETETGLDGKTVAEFCRKNGVTENAFYNAVFSFVLSRFIGRKETLYTTIYNGRSDSRLDRAVTMLVKTLPVVAAVDPEKSVAEYVTAMGKQLMGSMSHDIVSFAELAKTYGISSDVLFAYQGDGFIYDRIGGEEAETIPLGLNEAKAPILIEVFEDGTKVSFRSEYRSDLFSEDYIRGFMDCLEKTAAEFMVKGTLGEICILTEKAEKEIEGFNETGADYPVMDIVSMFRAAVEKYPDRQAVVFKDEILTYRQVDGISERIAGYLKKQGIGKGNVVSILISRSAFMATASLGVLKTGAAYQPLDPSYPEERLSFMMKDADCKLLIADEELLEKVPDYDGPKLLTKNIPCLPECDRLTEHPDPEDLFILLYTSGSTGVPKGVMLEHQNLANFCCWYRDYYGLDEDCRVAAYASYGFDACMMDMYPTLTTGASLYIAAEEIRLDLSELEAWINRSGITHSFMTTQVCRQFYTLASAHGLRYLTGGGEKLVPVEPKEGNPVLINGYGPTECTILTTSMPVKKLYRRIPIGRPITNYKCYVVDEKLRQLPPFVPGELLISGRGVGRGYLNRPEQTEKAFIRNPFTDDPGYIRAYRSGDVVRWLPDGTIDFIGRNDGQVKVRGFRIELSEVEAVIRQFSGIEDATVQAFEDEATGEKFIAAYVVSDSEVDVSAMNAFIAERKPPYMVPAVTMQIPSIPLNQNQKVNKRALPKPEVKTQRKSADQAPAAPLNVLEQELKDIIAEIVGTADFGIVDRLSDLGLTSISGIRLAMQIFKKYAVQFNARDLIAQGTIQMMENEILRKFLSGKGETDAPAEQKGSGAAGDQAAQQNTSGPAESADQKKLSARLSFAQQGVFAECQANPDTVQYNIPFVLKFPENISEEQLKAAVQKVVDAHSYILCRFVPDENNEIVQEPIPDFILDIPVSERGAEEFEAYKTDFVRPFDLAAGPAVRFEIVRSGALYLFVDMHHLVSDGSSMDLFFGELCRALDGQEIAPESYSYYDFVAEEAIDQETEDFFTGQMSELEEATQLIPDVYEEGLPHTARTISVDTDLAAVSVFARKNGVTPAAVYLAASYITFGRYVCEDTVAIATISSGRSNLKIGETMGMFVNTLPLVMTLDPKEEITNYLHRVDTGFSDTLAHENYPFARVASRFDFHPFISYAYQIGVISDYRTQYGSVEIEGLELDIAKIPVSVSITGTEEKAEISVEYDSALYSEAMMRGLAESIGNAAQGMINGSNVADISLTAEAQWKVLDGFNRDWDLDYDKQDTAVTVFKRNAAKLPDKLAAVYRDKVYTYRELDDLTDELAGKLYQKVCAITGKADLAEEVVAILLPRDENVFILPLAALKAGLAYEPLDPAYPKERLNFMVKDAGACLLLADETLTGLVDEYEGTVLTVQELYQMEKAPAVQNGPSPEDLFVMLYTSGSTGVPKGCQLVHSNLVSYAHGVRNDFYREDDRIAAYASFGFDVNMSDVFCTLLNGGTVYLIPEEIRMDLGALAAYFDEAGITALLLTTQVGVQFLQNYPKLKTLRMLVMGGEKLPAVDPERLSYTIVNGYGPTENCCGVSLFPIRAWEPNIPIGRPMSSIHGYILDKTGHRLPAGAAGEYCLSGPQVSRGYLNRPDKTAEAYEACPFNEFRMYHTGDIVRYRQNGDVEFVGRKDGQVKIRGFRIETKEVEAVIRSAPDIRDVTVQAYDYEGGGKFLAAFVVSDTTVDVSELAAYIKSKKPAYMVPAVIMQIDSIPLTVNQKVDKKALPKPEPGKAEYVAPQGKTEEDFCAIFGSVLGLEKMSVEEDFFEAGGSSILAMKVVIAAGKAGYQIVYNDVFKYTTPRTMAEHVGREGEKEAVRFEKIEILQPASGELPETGRDGYEYGRIHELLRRNTLEAFRNGRRQPLGDVLLLGGTGYLGCHVLRELITAHEGQIYCLIRPGREESGEQRLRGMLRYYFGDDQEALFGSRITVIEGDATDADSLNSFHAPADGLTVINCAASVKHFAKGDEIERINIGSVRNLASWCEREGARLVHISTCSVTGNRQNGMPPVDFRLDEHRLYAGQEIESNQYIYSKFMAERHIYEEILEHGLKAKVLRVGNLAPRLEDGEFQINYQTNSFMNTFRAFGVLGKVPYDEMDEQTEFSPIDQVSRAVLCLAETPEECTCFMLLNAHRPLFGDVIREMNGLGYPIAGAEAEEFAEALNGALSDEKTAEAVSSLIAYNGSDGIETIGLEGCNSTYTTQILERLGFSWPETGSAYIRSFLSKLEEKGYFKRNDQ